MAKIISPFVGSAKGKLGGAVYYTRTGGTFARQRVATVANPKTEAQLTTRVILSTASKAYRFFQPLADHAFQDMIGKAGNHQKFMSLNVNRLRSIDPVPDAGTVYVGFNPKGDETVLANPYIISAGSLPPANIEEGTVVPASGDDPAVQGAALILETTADTLTYREVINALGLAEGAQLTFVEAASITNDSFYSKLTYGRLILAPSDGDYDQAVFDAQGAVNNANSGNMGLDQFTFRAYKDNDRWYIAFRSATSMADGMTYAGCTVIFSQNEGGRWLRSFAEVALKNFDISEDYSLENAIASYEDGYNSSLYLNRAGRATNRRT